MGTLRACALVALSALAACGSDGKSNIDAMIILEDAAIDAPPDAAIPDAPSYDFSCASDVPPETADDPITATGSTQELTMSGIQAVADATVETFQAGTATPVDTVTSGANGSFTTGSLVTGGTPFNGHIRGTKTGYRATYVFPPSLLTESQPMVPVLMLSTSTFSLLSEFGASVTQDDVNNGALMIAMMDCAGTPVAGATLTVKQGGTEVGDQFDLSQISSMAAGIFFVFNVPDGETQVGGSYMGQNFHEHTVTSFKISADVPNGATSTSIVQPNP